MKSAILHGVRKQKPELHPVFEITGTIDSGKKLVAELVATRLAGSCIQLPAFDVSSFSGRALLHVLTQNPQSLEFQPHWWAHMYAANLHEQTTKILKAREYGPVIITNYMTAFKTWMKVAGLDSLSGFFGSLPEPLHAYSLYGKAIETSLNINIDFSDYFKGKINRAMRRPPTKKYTIVKMENSASTKYHESINKAAQEICTNINERYGLTIHEGFVYSSTLNITKK